MQNNPENFSVQEAMRLANTPAGQQLFALLQQSHGDALNKAMAQATIGDYESVKKTMSSLLQSDDVKAILQQFRGDQNG